MLQQYNQDTGLTTCQIFRIDHNGLQGQGSWECQRPELRDTMIRPITGELADQIFDVLVQECDANDMGRDEFISWATKDEPGNEYRFGGMFGLAGKIWLERESGTYPNGLRVSGPNHKELAEKHNSDELVAAVSAANERLAKLA